MSEFKGTPGAWQLETINDHNGEISEIYITQEGGGCILCVNDGDDNYDIERDLANAKLITAAPDLLEALTQLLDQYEACAGQHWQDSTNDEVVIKAKFAIKKALI